MLRIRLHGTAKKLAGKEELNLDVEGQITLEELLKRITESWEGISSKGVQVILVNGKNCIFLDGLETRVRNGDLVEVLPLVTGG
jgi:molybdopterin converting factor small subunit